MSADAQPSPAARALFSPKVVLAMVLVGVFSFSAFLALSAYAPDLRNGQDGRGHALSKSAIGFAGLADLLRAEGRTVLVTRGPPRGGEGVLVLTPEPGVASKEITAFHFGDAILLVLPKWNVIGEPLHPGWVAKVGPIDAADAASPLKGLTGQPSVERRKGVSSPLLGPGESPLFTDPTALRAGAIDSLQTFSGADFTPVLVDERGRMVLARSRKGGMFVLSDPDLMNNQGLAQLANARVAAAILDRLSDGRGPVVFDVTLNGFKRGRSLLRLMLEPPLLGVVICLLAAAALMGLHAAGRFGPPLRTGRFLALGKLALADNSAGLIRMARREPRMAEGYAALARETVARAVGAPRDLAAGEVDAVLDRLGAARAVQSPFSELAAEAQGVKTNRDLMRLARRLFEWRQEMTRERR